MFVVWLSVVSFCAVLVRVQRVRLGRSESLADLTGGQAAVLQRPAKHFLQKQILGQIDRLLKLCKCIKALNLSLIHI